MNNLSILNNNFFTLTFLSKTIFFNLTHLPSKRCLLLGLERFCCADSSTVRMWASLISVLSSKAGLRSSFGLRLTFTFLLRPSEHRWLGCAPLLGFALLSPFSISPLPLGQWFWLLLKPGQVPQVCPHGVERLPLGSDDPPAGSSPFSISLPLRNNARTWIFAFVCPRVLSGKLLFLFVVMVVAMGFPRRLFAAVTIGRISDSQILPQRKNAGFSSRQPCPMVK